MKKRVILIVLAIVLLLAAAVGVYYYLWKTDLEEKAELSVQLSIHSRAEQLHAGQSVAFHYSLENSSYAYAMLREYAVVSLYDAEGKPVCYDSMRTSSADIALTGENVTVMAVQDHQIIYALGEYPLSAAEPKYVNPFAKQAQPPQGFETAQSTRRNELMITMAEDAAERYQGVSVHTQLFVQRQADDTWQMLCTQAQVIGNAPQEVASELPKLTGTSSLAWDIHGDVAWVTGIGTTMESDIVIPAEVSLSAITPQEYRIFASEVGKNDFFKTCGEAYAIATANGIISSQEELLKNNVVAQQLLLYDANAFYQLLSKKEFPAFTLLAHDGTEVSKKNFRSLVPADCSKEQPFALTVRTKGELLIEDPFAGTTYPVVVAGNAFADCVQLRSVRFEEGVTVLEDTMYRQNRGMFSNCPNLEAVYDIPDSVRDMEDTFMDCVKLKTAPTLPQSVSSLGDTFYGCVSLQNGPEIPDSVTNMSNTFHDCAALTSAHIGANVRNIQGCFAGCSALESAPEIGPNVLDMNACFKDCVSLKTAQIGQNVTDAQNCFAGCTALETAPELPATLEDIGKLFAGCSSLSGTVTIPCCEEMREILPSIAGAFKGCEKIECVAVQYCEEALYRFTIPETIDLTFIGEHTEDGLCENCRTFSTQTEIDGLTVVFDVVSEKYYQDILNYVDNEVPDYMKNTCKKLTFTNDLAKYNKEYKEETYRGFARYPDGTAYVKVQSELPYYTLMHELAHCYDHKFSLYARFSGASAWRELHAQEEAAASSHYNAQSYNALNEADQRSETFAIAVGFYFTDPELLQTQCPGMYAYLCELLSGS